MVQAGQLHNAVEAVCPISGVWIGDPNDASTWGCWYAKDATPTQQAAALTTINSFATSAGVAGHVIATSIKGA